MKRYLLALICLNCLVSLVYAQEETRIEEKDTLSSLESEVGLIPESLDANVDSLLRTWHVQYFSKREDFCHDDDENVYFPDSVYIDRLSRLPSVIALPYNNIVRDCIDLYAERKRNLVRYMLGMADFYFPIIEQVLDEHGLPIELKYLAVVESALNPVALSRVGACGLWQFMLPTGKSYGLEINSLVDERRDPLKATEAACKYFKDMYAIYGDWNLVLASYNCGPGNVNKAIRRSGGKTDFWDIFPYLPKETRSYVPLFIAANYVMNYYCEHNICPMQTFSRKKCSHFSPTNIPSAFPHEIPKCILIILLIPKKSSMLIAAILFCHRSFDSTTRRIPLSNEISAVSATISLLTPSEQNPRRQASVRGYFNPFSVRCPTHSV